MTISLAGITVVVGRGTWLCADCQRVKVGRTIRAERCLGCTHRYRQKRLAAKS
jgi:hypothetical protein